MLSQDRYSVERFSVASFSVFEVTLRVKLAFQTPAGFAFAIQEIIAAHNGITAAIADAQPTAITPVVTQGTYK
jgi:hypothetical protein